MNWQQLLSKDRLGREPDSSANADRTAFQVDYDRIVFSSAFRRLQDKTQVFPLAQSDYVRTRLTHSLEVSCIARSLGMKVGLELCDKHNLEAIQPHDISTILSTAALAHDLGNPPFGHSGEDAIRHWFMSSSVVKDVKKSLTERELCDITNYEGNAQGFRLLTVLQMPENRGGMQLTHATLGAFVKYPVESIMQKSDDTISRKKFNFFDSEKEFFKEIASSIGLKRTDDQHYCWTRHPLVFLVEASDDICYRVIDFEDGFRLGLVSFNEIRDLFAAIIKSDSLIDKINSLDDNKGRIEYLRAKVMQKLVDEVTEAFLDNEQSLLNGSFEESIISILPSRQELSELKKRAAVDVYSDRRVIEIEAAGFEVASGLLDIFFRSSMDIAYNNTASAQSKKVMQLLPKKYHARKDTSNYINLLRILDYFSGMTDSFAVSIYKKLKGISLPGQ